MKTTIVSSVNYIDNRALFDSLAISPEAMSYRDHDPLNTPSPLVWWCNTYDSSDLWRVSQNANAINVFDPKSNIYSVEDPKSYIHRVGNTNIQTTRSIIHVYNKQKFIYAEVLNIKGHKAIEISLVQLNYSGIKSKKFNHSLFKWDEYTTRVFYFVEDAAMKLYTFNPNEHKRVSGSSASDDAHYIAEIDYARYDNSVKFAPVIARTFVEAYGEEWLSAAYGSTVRAWDSAARAWRESGDIKVENIPYYTPMAWLRGQVMPSSIKERLNIANNNIKTKKEATMLSKAKTVEEKLKFLLAESLSEITLNSTNCSPEIVDYPDWSRYNGKKQRIWHNKAYIEDMKNGWAVLRMFYPNHACDDATGETTLISYSELTRAYINYSAKKMQVIYVRNSVASAAHQGNWTVNKDQSPFNYGYYYYSASSSIDTEFMNPEAMNDIPRLKYIYKAMKDMNSYSSASHTSSFFSSVRDYQRFCDVVRHPIIETLISAGYSNIVKWALDGGTIEANLKDIFGLETLNLNAKKLPAKFGVNSHIMSYIDTHTTLNRWGSTIQPKLERIRTLVAPVSLADIDNDTFDVMYANLEEIRDLIPNITNNNRNRYYGHYRLRYQWTQWSEEERSDWKKFVLKLVKKNNETFSYTSYIGDIIEQYFSLDTEDRIPDFFNTLYSCRTNAEYEALHDAMTQLNNARRAIREREWAERNAENSKRLKLKEEELRQKRVELYEYCDNIGGYSIVVPTAAQIVAEGANLHHCVATYANRFQMGTADILFLRKNDELDKSFYTIECDIHSAKVIQIHGFGNKWLGNNPEAIPTVMRWLKAKSISCPDYMLLDTAKGYGSSGNYVEKPVID